MSNPFVDEGVGALVVEQYKTAEDSKIKIGDEVIFKVRKKLFLRFGKPVPQLTGTVLQVLPGYERCYLIRVHAGKKPWLPQIVSEADVALVRW